MRRDDWTLFFERHKPKANPFDPDASINGTMLETYGKELDLVKQADPHFVFTLVDADGKQYACPGLHLVNRIGFIIVEIPWSNKTSQRNYML